jgi:hypothetical protein
LLEQSRRSVHCCEPAASRAPSDVAAQEQPQQKSFSGVDRWRHREMQLSSSTITTSYGSGVVDKVID